MPSEEPIAIPSRECLHIRVERESVYSPDLHLHRVEISFDDIEIDIDADMLNGIQVRDSSLLVLLLCFLTFLSSLGFYKGVPRDYRIRVSTKHD